jgi:hypothetical protein
MNTSEYTGNVSVEEEEYSTGDAYASLNNHFMMTDFSWDHPQTQITTLLGGHMFQRLSGGLHVRPDGCLGCTRNEATSSDHHGRRDYNTVVPNVL